MRPSARIVGLVGVATALASCGSGSGDTAMRRDAQDAVITSVASASGGNLRASRASCTSTGDAVYACSARVQKGTDPTTITLRFPRVRCSTVCDAGVDDATVADTGEPAFEPATATSSGYGSADAGGSSDKTGSLMTERKARRPTTRRSADRIGSRNFGVVFRQALRVDELGTKVSAGDTDGAFDVVNDATVALDTIQRSLPSPSPGLGTMLSALDDVGQVGDRGLERFHRGLAAFDRGFDALRAANLGK